MKKILRNFSLLAFVFGALVLLSGCWPFGKKKVEEEDLGGTVLAKIDGSVVMKTNKFYKLLSGFVGQMDPALLPKKTQKKLLDNWLQIEVGVRAAMEQKVDKNEEFLKLYREQKKHLKREMLFRFFDNENYKNVDVSKEEMADHYAKNKYLYAKEPGGALVYGVLYDKKDKAMKFYDKIKNKLDDFVSVGKKEKDGKFREFGRVGKVPSKYSVVPASVRDASLKLSKLPAADLVVDDKDNWVIYVSDKKDPVFFDFDDVEERIEKQLKLSKYMKLREKIYKDLEKKFNVEINEDYFKEAEPAAGAPELPQGNEKK